MMSMPVVRVTVRSFYQTDGVLRRIPWVVTRTTAQAKTKVSGTYWFMVRMFRERMMRMTRMWMRMRMVSSVVWIMERVRMRWWG